jgi:hypothetical protein
MPSAAPFSTSSSKDNVTAESPDTGTPPATTVRVEPNEHDDPDAVPADTEPASIEVSRAAFVLLRRLQAELQNLDWDSALRRWGSPEGIGDALVAAIPHQLITDPPFGYVYTAQQVATIRGISPQAVHRQHQRGVLLAVRRGRRVLYPGLQFDRFFFPSVGFRQVIDEADMSDRDAEDVFVWLHTPGADGTRPADRIAALDEEHEATRLPYSWEVTIVDPREHLDRVGQRREAGE